MGKHSFETDYSTLEEVDVIEELIGEKQIIVYNDDVNTFDHVIDSLVKICSHTAEQAEQCSMIIHFRGKASVKHGIYEDLAPMADGLKDRGIDANIE